MTAQNDFEEFEKEFSSSTKNTPSSSANETIVDDALVKEHLSSQVKGKNESPLVMSKVELDLEDAPFLIEEEPEPPKPEIKETLTLEPKKKEKEVTSEPNWLQRKLKEKKVRISLIGLSILLAAIIFFIKFPIKFGEDSPKKPAPKIPELSITDSTEPKKDEIKVTWEPFWIEQKDKEENIRFLICNFGATVEGPELQSEINSKTLTIRDALYYYLKSKDLMFLSDKNNVDILKKDLLSIINQYLSTGKINELLIENYLVK